MVGLIRSIIAEPWAISPEYAAHVGIFLKDFLERHKAYSDEEENYFSEQKNGRIAEITIRGELLKYDTESGRKGMGSIAEEIRRLDNDESISGLLLIIDSPGGTVAGTEELAKTINEFSKPVYAYIDGMATSAAYWIASAADKIYAHLDYDLVGSIGVMFELMDVQPYYEKMGVKFHRIYADQSADKNDIFEKVLQGDYELLKKERLNPLAENFRNYVKNYRKNILEEQLTGKTYFAKDVVGTLIDGIVDLDIVREELKNQNNNNVMAEEKTTFWGRIGKALGLNSPDAMDPEDIALTMQLKITQLEQEKQKYQVEIQRLTELSEKLTAEHDELEKLNAQLKKDLESISALAGDEKAEVIKDTDAIKKNDELQPVVTDSMSLNKAIEAVKKAYKL